MKTLNYKGHEITVFETYNGDEFFITKNGEKVYSAKANKGQGEEMAKWILR